MSKQQLPYGMQPDIMTHYPHMMSEDTEVWTKYLAAKRKIFLRVWYDLHVGSVLPTREDSTGQLAKIAQGVTRKRIDVVAETADKIYIIEVKPYGNMVALGQAISYRRMFNTEFAISKPSTAVICCNIIDQDILDDCIEQGVEVWEVQAWQDLEY